LLPKDYFDPSGLLKLNEKDANNIDDSDSDETSLSDVIMQHEKRVLGKKKLKSKAYDKSEQLKTSLFKSILVDFDKFLQFCCESMFFSTIF